MERVDILEKIKRSETRDNKVIKTVEEMKKAGVKMLRNEEWREEDSIMLKEEKVYVPKDKALRVIRNFWWPEVTREVKWYVEKCDTCQQ